MRIVAREKEQLGSGVPDEIAGIFSGKRREFDVATNEFRRLHRERLQKRVGTAEAAIAEIQLAQERRNPGGAELDHTAAQIRKAVEHSVVDQCGKKHLRRIGQNDEVLEAEIFSAAVKVR